MVGMYVYGKLWWYKHNSMNITVCVLGDSGLAQSSFVPVNFILYILDGRRQGSSKLSERSVRFEPNLRSERVRYFSEHETNVQTFKRLISL